MNLFIFGSTGDLVKRKVLPALSELDIKKLNIFAIGRREFVDEIYIDFACDEDCKIKDQIHYFKTSFESGDICEECKKNLEKDKVNYFYVSLPPNLLMIIFRKIKKIKELGFDVRILVEKPFGNSLKEAKKLYKMIKEFKLEDNTFLNDHYLFKQETIGIKKQDFKKLKIIILEKLGLENRISYYDESGALIDMVQSHLFNLLFKFLTEKEIKNIKIISYEKKQYEGYIKELGKRSSTETFVRVKLKTGGKKIELITGKKFSKKISKIIIDGIEKDFEDRNPYACIFSSFFKNQNENFPSIKSAITSWGIIESIKSKKIRLETYPQGTDINAVIMD